MFDDDKGECKNRRNAHEQWTIFIFPGFSKTSNHWVNFYSGKWETTEMMILASRLLQLQKKKCIYICTEIDYDSQNRKRYKIYHQSRSS